MKIAFNCSGGLGNNGGSRTVIRCQQTIKKLGHDCNIITNNDRFNWFTHDTTLPRIPSNIDALIATDIKSVKPTVRSNAKNKFWYIRGHEIWVPGWDEDKLISYYKNSRVTKITNSIWMKKFIESFGGKCHLVYQGIDFDWWKDYDLRSERKITIGCLWSKLASKGWPSFEVLHNLLGKDNYRFVAFGNKKLKKQPSWLDKYIVNPNRVDLAKLYSECDVWFAPTELEGLHNVPMEASLCGARIVCGDHPRNGMADYATEDTAYIYDDHNIAKAAELINGMIFVDNKLVNMNNTLRHKIGSREKNMKKFIKILEDKVD